MTIKYQKEIESLPPQSKVYKKGCGDGLLVVVNSGGSKSFVGVMTYEGKRPITQIGTTKFYSLKNAKQRWNEIKKWSVETGNDPRDYKKLVLHPKKKKKVKTLKFLIDSFLKDRTDIKEITLRNYRNQLNQVLQIIDGNTPLNLLEWDEEGRDWVLKVRQVIENRGSYEQSNRVHNTLYRVFNYGEGKKLMGKGTNPCMKHSSDINKHIPKHNPSITWDQVPKFLEDVSENSCGGTPVTDLCVKFLLMTFLRVGTLVRMEWDWFDEEKDCWVIPSQTSGLKRRKGVDNQPHFIPMTEPLREVMRRLKRYTGHQKYVFWSFRGKTTPHLSVEVPNRHLRNLGYKSVLTSHGWRQLPLTYGQDLLKISSEVIQRQMSHTIGDKTRKSYDRSIQMDERRDFMEKWCSLLIETGLKI